MADTKIEWAKKSWNPVTGCTKVSAGCKNCYAEQVANRFWGDRKFTDIRLHPDRLLQPIHWKKPCRLFVNSMSDLFHESISFNYIDKVFAVMHYAKQHKFIILTKRPERMLKYLADTFLTHNRINRAHFDLGLKNVALREFPLSNVWLGVSVENQETANLRIPILLDTPAAVRVISAEPLLGPINFAKSIGLNRILEVCAGNDLTERFLDIDWIIVGGESGNNARPMHPEWVKFIRDRCKYTGIPFFFKQWGSWKPINHRFDEKIKNKSVYTFPDG